ncbi:hypothetical protein KK030_11930 [Enterobacter roggenkampii]|nr:hypothetical protein KK030_11930 [Enterobacter roggenkampii]
MNVVQSLKKFEEKRTPDDGRISLNYENAIHYDMYSVYIVDNAGEQYLFERYIDDQVHAREGANKQVISSQADSLIKISRIWADFFPANTSNQPI